MTLANRGFPAILRDHGYATRFFSAAAFGCMAIFGKLAYDEGVTVGTLLSARFALAALLSSTYGVYNGFEICEAAAVPGFTIEPA